MQIEQARVQAKAQADMELKTIRVSNLKSSLSRLSIERRIKRNRTMVILVKRVQASIQGEVRKAVQEQSAMNQSQMIEQRKDQKRPFRLRATRTYLNSIAICNIK